MDINQKTVLSSGTHIFKQFKVSKVIFQTLPDRQNECQQISC